MEESLFPCKSHGTWKAILDQYPVVMKKKADDNKKKELTDLDTWFQIELPKTIASRSPRHITKEEIIKLMKWKLMRGKFRPRLTELIKQNSDQDVKKTSENAFKNAESCLIAIKELSKLKAVGPATASAIMCAANPEIYAFMADEAMASIPSFKVDYTLSHCSKFQKRLADKAEMLKKDSDFDWTPHKVELALWTHLAAKKLGVTLGVPRNQETENSGGEKRKKTDDTNEEPEEDLGKRRKRK